MGALSLRRNCPDQVQRDCGSHPHLRLWATPWVCRHCIRRRGRVRTPDRQLPTPPSHVPLHPCSRFATKIRLSAILSRRWSSSRRTPVAGCCCKVSARLRPSRRAFCYYALIPGDLLGHVFPGNAIRVSETRACVFDGTANPSTPISSMFMHGGWFHILGNMWFLWVFGDNVEDAMGPFRFVVFYILCGLAAAFAQFATDPASPRAHGWRVRRHRRCHGRICPTLSPGPTCTRSSSSASTRP